jgi:hypothetical protein
MAGNGPAPKEQHQRERDTKRRQADSVTVTDDGQRRGPELGGDYPVAVHEWYETWRTSPQAALFEATDWQRLRMLAPLVQSYLTVPSTAALAEIRLNEERLGATYVDRQRARIRIDSSTGPTAPVTPLRAVGKTDAMARLRGEK